MIYTVTISPAIDYVVHLDRLQKGATNRSTGDINVKINMPKNSHINMYNLSC